MNLEGVDTSTWTKEDWHENYGIGARAHPDYPVSVMGISSPLMPSYEGEEITGCTINECDSGEDPVLSVRYHNPTFTKDYTHHMCYQCADNWDMGHLVHHTLKPEVSEKPDIRIAKENLQSNIHYNHWQTALNPLHEAMSAGYDNYEHIGSPYQPAGDVSHLNDRMLSRLPMSDQTNASPHDAHVRFPESTMPVQLSDEHHLHNDFLHMGNLKLEHYLRANPTALDDLQVGDSLSLQVAHDRDGGFINPDADKNAPYHVKNAQDMHIVYRKTKMQNGDIKYQPRTIQSTPDFSIKSNRTKMMVAHPKSHRGALNSLVSNTLHNYMRDNNEHHGFDSDIHFPEGIYNQTYAKAKPETVEAERAIHNLDNELSPALSKFFKYSNKNQRVTPQGQMGQWISTKDKSQGRKNWWTGPNGFTTRANLIQEELQSGNLSKKDAMLLYDVLIQHALNTGIGKHEIDPTNYQIKQHMNPNNEEYAEAYMSIKKAERTKLKYKLLKHDIMVLKNILKERKTPEAMRHKREYDTKYESSPERIKYREELNRERHRRGMYGDHSHRDISHTAGGKLTVEGEHENRQRHFKDKGTLRPLTKAVRDDLEMLRNLMSGPMDEQDKKIAQTVMASLEEREAESKSESENELSHIFFGGTPMKTQ